MGRAWVASQWPTTNENQMTAHHRWMPSRSALDGWDRRDGHRYYQQGNPLLSHTSPRHPAAPNRNRATPTNRGGQHHTMTSRRAPGPSPARHRS